MAKRNSKELQERDALDSFLGAARSKNVLPLFGHHFEAFFDKWKRHAVLVVTAFEKSADMMCFVGLARRNRCPDLSHAEDYSPLRRLCRRRRPSTPHRKCRSSDAVWPLVQPTLRTTVANCHVARRVVELC